MSDNPLFFVVALIAAAVIAAIFLYAIFGTVENPVFGFDDCNHPGIGSPKICWNDTTACEIHVLTDDKFYIGQCWDVETVVA